MSTAMEFLINYVDPAITRGAVPADYIEVDLVNDYLIWTAGDATIKDLMTSTPTGPQLSAASTVISDISPTTVALCLLYDYSHNVGGSYYTHQVKGMGLNNAYVFCFAFDGATATIPRLEAWDTDAHTTANNHVLGAGTALNSFVKAVRTTDGTLPGTGWAGTALAGAANYIELDSAVLSGAKDLYANIKIVIPTAYATPAAETFVLTVRYTHF